VPACDDCSDARAVPGLTGDYEACPSCVIDAGETFVVLSGGPAEMVEEDPPPVR
jgi:hypothetical protein